MSREDKVWFTTFVVVVVTTCVALVLIASGHASDRSWLTQAFRCIQHHETGDAWTGHWRANTGNGYYGGLQMDRDFMLTYGSEYVRLWGWANNWPIRVQIRVAARAYHGYAGYGPRGFGPWPKTRKKCGL